MMRLFLMTVMSLLLLTACNSEPKQVFNKSTYEIIEPTNGKFHPIIRLGEGCTGFVINDTTALTAGHCLDNTQYYVDNFLPKFLEESYEIEDNIRFAIKNIKDNCYSHPLTPPQVCDQYLLKSEKQLKDELDLREKKSKVSTYKIFDINGVDTGISAIAYDKRDYWSNRKDRRDYGYIKGDFKKFNKVKVKLDHGVKFGDTLRVCGFPGTKVPAVCLDYRHIGSQGFDMKGHMMLVPGVSGSPVFNHNNEVVAIAIGVNGEYGLLTPLLGILNGK